ncbi:MAG: hypothetical protein MMC33_002655 [Icmadophila ericetorum]|nr:hypothetical protein [Icmadophila ericetorum]
MLRNYASRFFNASSLLKQFARARPTVLPPRVQLARPYAQSRLPPGSQRQRPQYNRFGRAQGIKYLWQTSSTFRYGLGTAGAGATTFVALNIETVPVSGRKRFNWVSPKYEQEMGEAQYQQTMQQFQGAILPDHHPYSKLVRKVLDRLIPASGLENEAWEVHVINAPNEMNAFVVPGGKVFVFSGLLGICETEEGLATVLGHEIAHNVAHHAAENYSRISIVLPLAWLASYMFDFSGQLAYMVLDYAYSKPGSRRQESEADRIGLMMMAQSCYNPEEAVHLWQRMEKAEKVKIPQFLSTHPSSHNRIGQIKAWLPEAEQKRADSECGRTIEYANGFRQAMGIEDESRGSFW